MKPPFVIFLHSADYERVYQAVSMIATATAMGRPAYLFLFYDALGALVRDGWTSLRSSEERRGRMFSSINTPELLQILDGARESVGGVQVAACSTSVRILELETETVRRRVDEIVGLVTMLEISGEAWQSLYL